MYINYDKKCEISLSSINISFYKKYDNIYESLRQIARKNRIELRLDKVAHRENTREYNRKLKAVWTEEMGRDFMSYHGDKNYATKL
jgi:hypothetical protein